MRSRTFPRADFFLPSAWKEQRLRDEVLARARQGSVVHISHGECLDGAAADALVRLRHGDAAVSTIFTEPDAVVPKLEAIAAAGIAGEGRSLLLSDVSPQRSQRDRLEQALGTLNERGWRIEWRDHHGAQWQDGLLDAVKRKADHVRVALDNQECGTSLVQLDLLPSDAYARELAAVVRDIDLWVRKDPRSETLTHALHQLGNRALVAKLVRDRVVLDAELERAARLHKDQLERDLARALARAWFVEGKHRVGVVYGDFPGSQACDALRTQAKTDLEINLKPSGKFSLRSRPELPLCHAVAQRFRGGGHPNASGGRIRPAAWAWPFYWLSGGKVREAGALARAAADADVPGGAPAPRR
ncbi:MAG TPA: hypothetical protein VGR28_05920 [Candidatus Thermoplasmatota archaeon]|nr:hypothetical protein [Candidatus Thermoplasmatota archaeon]